MRALWEELASDDAGTAYRAASVLAGLGEKGLPFLAERLRPAPADDPGLRRLIADLEAPRYVVRLAARGELAGRGAEAVPALKAAFAAAKTPRARRALAELLALPGSKRLPHPLRLQRAAWVLGRIGTPVARKILQGLEDGGK